MIILQYLYIVIIGTLSLLPLRVLYLFSDIVYPIAYYIIRYRRKVVYRNLHNSFPEKSQQEINKIAKAFYHHFCDFLFEYVKLISISEKELMKRCKFKNLEILDKYYNKNQSVIAVESHYCNWEWAPIVMPLVVKQQAFAIYKPLTNKYIEKFVIKLRTRFGLNIIPMKQTLRIMSSNKNKQTLNVFASDQSPMRHEIEYWTDFLNQKTPVFLGSEKISKLYNYGIVFLRQKKVKRGYYEVEIIDLCENPKETKEYEITELHVKELESVIKETPEYWLWSHKRWKHKYEN